MPGKDYDDIDDDNAVVAQTLLVEMTQLWRTKLPNMILVSTDQEQLHACLEKCLRGLEIILQSEYRSTWHVGLNCPVIWIEHVHEHVSVLDTVEAIVQSHDFVALLSKNNTYQ